MRKHPSTDVYLTIYLGICRQRQVLARLTGYVEGRAQAFLDAVDPARHDLLRPERHQRRPSFLGGVVVSLAASTCSNARLRLLLDTTRKNFSAPIWLR